jgi:hypothetical protein
MKGTLIILFFILGPLSVFSQDHIITKKGKDLSVNITEIRQTDVTFTMYNDSSSTPYVMDKEEIEKIVFENGAEERFGNQNNETILNNNNTNRNKDPDKIYTTDGRVIYCEVVELKRFGVNYIPVKSTDNYVEYLANTKIDRIEYANGNVDYISGSPQNTKNRKDPKDFSYLSPHYISVNVGPAIPFGVFGGIGTSTIASTGVDVNIDATYYLFRGMGFGITGGYMYNPYTGTQQQSLALSQVPANSTNVDVRVDGWSNAYVMAGLGYYNEYKRLLLDYKAMFGAFFSFYPTARATYTNNGITQTTTYTDQSISYIFGGQVSARYFLTRKFQLKFNVATMFGRGEFQGLIRRDYQNGQQVSESVAGQLAPINLSWINFSVGVVYTLGK